MIILEDTDNRNFLFHSVEPSVLGWMLENITTESKMHFLVWMRFQKTNNLDLQMFSFNNTCNSMKIPEDLNSDYY